MVAVNPGKDGREEEKDAVHDAEREAGLEHCASLVGIDFEAIAAEGAENAKVNVVGRTGGDVGAVGAGDEAEVVNTCDECANETCGKGDSWSASSFTVAQQEEQGEIVGEPYRDQSAQRILHWRYSCGRGIG